MKPKYDFMIALQVVVWTI